MLDLSWDQEAEPKTNDAQLDKFESTLGIKIPGQLRQLWTRVSYRTPQRDGEDACYAILQNSSDGKVVESATFLGFSEPDLDDPAISWLKGKYQIKPGKVIAFAYNGNSSIFLNYDNDPTNSNPEVWNSDTEGDSLEESWYLIAPDVSSFLASLRTESEILELKSNLKN